MSILAPDPLGVDRVPVGPGMSMFDPMYVGIDEFGEPVFLDVVYRNLSPRVSPAAANPAC